MKPEKITFVFDLATGSVLVGTSRKMVEDADQNVTVMASPKEWMNLSGKIKDVFAGHLFEMAKAMGLSEDAPVLPILEEVAVEEVEVATAEEIVAEHLEEEKPEKAKPASKKKAKSGK